MKEYRFAFSTKREWPRFKLVFSVSGAPRDDSIAITLDGAPIPFASRGDEDRHFYSVLSSGAATTLRRGAHTLVVRAGGRLTYAMRGAKAARRRSAVAAARGVHQPPLMLCHAMLWGIGSAAEYRGGDRVGAYPDFDENVRHSVPRLPLLH